MNYRFNSIFSLLLFVTIFFEIQLTKCLNKNENKSSVDDRSGWKEIRHEKKHDANKRRALPSDKLPSSILGVTNGLWNSSHKQPISGNDYYNQWLLNPPSHSNNDRKYNKGGTIQDSHKPSSELLANEEKNNSTRNKNSLKLSRRRNRKRQKNVSDFFQQEFGKSKKRRGNNFRRKYHLPKSERVFSTGRALPSRYYGDYSRGTGIYETNLSSENTYKSPDTKDTTTGRKDFSSNHDGHDSYTDKEKVQKRPNIILILTDDLDIELGSLNYMPRLLSVMGGEGAMFSNAYTTTPMCCPSRSSMLTGMFIHNHQVFTNHQNCSSPNWQKTHERKSFASYLSEAGYRTGYVGKYLNRYNGSHIPYGWNDWAALVMNSRYYNYTVNKNSRFVKYRNRYPQDYYPHVITREGVEFLKQRQTSHKDDPFMLVLSYPSPHGPEDSAPEHAHKFFNASDHHTAAYNYAPNPDKQWILQFTDRMPDVQLKYTDLLMTKRLQTLQTIDEAIEKVVKAVDEIGETDNTYLFFTSDHGYHLGQYGLAKGKSMPFEFDIKVPFLVKGPDIKAGIQLPHIALNVDLAPTFLDIAGIQRPPQMDGRSLLSILKNSKFPEKIKDIPWRDSFLVESSGRLREEELLEKMEQRTWERERAMTMTLLKASSESNTSIGYVKNAFNLYTSKHERLEEVCKRTDFAFPCAPEQKWHCIKIGHKWKVKKCRQKMAVWQKHCICRYAEGYKIYSKLDPDERRKQKNFLKKYISKDFHTYVSKFLKTFNSVGISVNSSAKTSKQKNKKKRRYNRRRVNRSVTQEIIKNPKPDKLSNEGKIQSQNYSLPSEFTETNSAVNLDTSVHDFVEEEEMQDLKDQIITITDELETLEGITGGSTGNLSSQFSDISTTPYSSSSVGCKENRGNINCQDEVYENLSVWRNSKTATEDQITRLRQQLLVMKTILRHLQTSKPKNSFDDEYEDYSIGLDSPLYKNLNVSYKGKKSGQNVKTFREESNDLYFGNYDSDDEGDFIGNGELYPIPLSELVDDDDLKSGKNLPKKICWCNRRIMKKMEIKEAREKRRQERMEIKQKRRNVKRRQRKKKEISCNYYKLNCYTHTNDHWKTPPLWTDGNFCFCMNSANNTYWCLRTINNTHNYLYCEFITGLITYYDLHIDPYQLRNVAFTLSNSRVIELHKKLTQLRNCKGADECDGLEVTKSNKNERRISIKLANQLHKYLPIDYENGIENIFGFGADFRRKNNGKDERRRILKEKRINKKKIDAFSLYKNLARRRRHKRLKKLRRKERKRQRRLHRKHKRQLLANF